MPLLWPMIGGPQQSLESTLSQPRFIVVAIVSGAAFGFLAHAIQKAGTRFWPGQTRRCLRTQEPVASAVSPFAPRTRSTAAQIYFLSALFSRSEEHTSELQSLMR